MDNKKDKIIDRIIIGMMHFVIGIVITFLVLGMECLFNVNINGTVKSQIGYILILAAVVSMMIYEIRK
jgi:vacuolar-type H+-ATPase subunit I/STV1